GSLTVPLVTSGGSVVLGNSDLAYGERPGGRWMVGFWLNERHVFGFEAGGFLMDWPSVSAAVNSNLFGSPGLERPVINALTGAPASVLVSLPATFAGGVAFTSESRMWGAEATFVRNLASDCHFHADLLFGFRFLDLEENLNVGQTSLVLGGSGIGPAP